MLAAQRVELQETAKKRLLEIRAKELQLFIDLYNSVGTQVALLGGFLLNAIVNTNTNFSDVREIKNSFFCAAVLSLVLGLYVILTTTLTTVWGPGLALRGPPGSVVKSVDILMKERRFVVWAFFGMLTLYFFSSMFASWLIMSQRAAAISTVVYFVAGVYIYCTCSQLVRELQAPMDSDWRADSTGADAKPGGQQRNTRLQHIFGRTQIGYPKPGLQGAAFSGNLTRRHGNNWQRVFAVVHGTALYLFRNRNECVKKQRPLINRPIDLHEYDVVAQSAGEELRQKSRSATERFSGLDAGLLRAALEISLRPRNVDGADTGASTNEGENDGAPLDAAVHAADDSVIRASLVFRADTYDEWDMWCAAFTQATDFGVAQTIG